jgi:hypothetical protein
VLEDLDDQDEQRDRRERELLSVARRRFAIATSIAPPTTAIVGSSTAPPSSPHRFVTATPSPRPIASAPPAAA